MEEVGDLAFLLWDLCYRLGEDKKKEHYSFKGGREACEVSKAVRPTTSLLPIAFTTRVRRRAGESQILTYSLATAFEKTKGEKKKKNPRNKKHHVHSHGANIMAGERHSAVNITAVSITAVSVTVSDLMCELHAEGQEGAMHVGRGAGGEADASELQGLRAAS